MKNCHGIVVLLLGVAVVLAAGLPGALAEAPPSWRVLPLVADGAIDPCWKHLWGGGFSVIDDGSLRTDCTDAGMGLLLTLRGSRVFVDVDGKRLTTFDSESPDVPPRKHWSEPRREPKRPLSGFIGLQNHDPGDVVYYKEVSVRPLEGAARSSESGRR